MSESRDRKAESNWTLNQSWDPTELGMINIETMQVEEPERKKPVYRAPSTTSARFDNSDVGMGMRAAAKKKESNTAAMDRWVEQQSKKGSLKRALMLSLVILAIIAAMVSMMLGTAHAGTAFMKFHVIAISDDVITLEDENGDSFEFYNEDGLDLIEGQEVTVATMLTYKGKGLWAWHSQLTGIIQ